MYAPLPARSAALQGGGERKAALERLLAWAKKGGARWEGIDVTVDDNGDTAIRASRSLAEGETILVFPRELMIVDNELATSATGTLELGLPDPRPRDALTAWLPLEAREPGSPWRVYLDALPVQLPELPMFRDADQLAALAGTAAYAIATAIHRDVLDTYEQLSPVLRARLSLADFAWGCAIVKSRAFHAPATFEERIALLPIVDLFNHGLGDTNWTYDPGDGTFEVVTERAFAAGDEVFFPYAERSNTRLLVEYGFTLPDNAFSEAELLFDATEGPIRMRVACVLDDRFLGALSLARLQAAGPDGLARARDLGLAEDEDLPWLGAAFEEAAFTVIAGAARRSLDALDAHPPRSIDDAWGGHCQVVRDAERAVLEQVLELTSLVRNHLHAEPAQVEAAAAAIAPDATGAQRLLRQYLEALVDDVRSTTAPYRAPAG